MYRTIPKIVINLNSRDKNLLSDDNIVFFLNLRQRSFSNALISASIEL